MENLENFGVQDLNAKEMENTNGGALFGLFAALFVVGFLWRLGEIIFED